MATRGNLGLSGRVNLAALVGYEYGALTLYWYRGWI
jgi:hypothetical protein